MTEICRTCLQEVGDSSVVFYLDAVESQSETITIRCKLADCVPEMDLDVVPNAFICNSCFESLTAAHEFKNKCLETEGRIQSYIEQMGYVLTSVDLRDIVQQSKMQPLPDVKPQLGSSDFSAFMQSGGKNSSHEIARTTLYDTNKNSIIDPLSLKENKFYVKDEPKETSLDLKNLQCDTRAFFAVPKIAQLLAEGDRNSYKCSQCSYKASSDFDLKSHEETHLSQKRQKCDTRDFFTVPKMALLIKDNGTSLKCNQCTYIACSDLDLKMHQEFHYNQKSHNCDTRDFFNTPKIAQLLGKDNGTLYRCSQCTYVACSDLDLKSHEEVHFNQKPQKCDTRDLFSAPKIAQLLAEGDRNVRKCTQCTYMASSDYDLKSHEETHFNQNLQKCDTQDFFSVPKIAQLLAEGNRSPYTCSQCTYIASSELDLQSHEETHFNQKLHKCTECNYSASKRQTLIIHMRKHSGKKPFHCNECGYNTPYRNTLVQHLRAHTGEKRYKCTLCDFTSVYSSALSKHIKTHSDEKPFKCKLCNYRARLKFDLKIHMRVHTGEKPYKCLLCDYSSSHKTNLGYHMRIHTGEKPYKCKMCDYRSSQKANLQNHIRTHTGERPFKCNQCQYSTAHSKSLTTHMKIHTGEKQPYACTFCDYSSSTKVNLIKHVMTHTGEKPFQCFDCGYRTITKVDLEQHMSIHTTKTPTCSVCQKSLGNVENLTKHMKQHKKHSSKTLHVSRESNVGKSSIDSTAHINSDLSESTSDAGSATHVSAGFPINRDTNNCESAVKKEMII